MRLRTACAMISTAIVAGLLVSSFLQPSNTVYMQTENGVIQVADASVAAGGPGPSDETPVEGNAKAVKYDIDDDEYAPGKVEPVTEDLIEDRDNGLMHAPFSKTLPLEQAQTQLSNLFQLAIAQTKPAERYTTVKVKPGQNLMSVLTGAGIDRGDAYAAIEAMRKVFDPRRIRANQAIKLTFNDNTKGNAFTGFEFKPDQTKTIRIHRDRKNQFVGSEAEKQLRRELVTRSGTITSTLAHAGEAADVPSAVMGQMTQIYTWMVDFSRDIRPNDKFEVMYEQFVDPATETVVKNGVIKFATLNLSGKNKMLYRFEKPNGRADYFDEAGQSARKALLRKPTARGWTSSHYGLRRHPILKVKRMHYGVDYAAPLGTPIYAAGDGVIEAKGRRGGYGNHIVIRHQNGYKTLYAHLRSYAKGLHNGKRVNQGDVIAYMGSTGLSTGSHLHYEIHVNGKKVNPLKIRLPKGEKLKGADFRKFQQVVSLRQDQLEQTRSGVTMVADAGALVSTSN